MHEIADRNAVRGDVCQIFRPSFVRPSIIRSLITAAIAAIAFVLVLAPISLRAQVTTFAGVVIENNCNAKVFEPDDKQWHLLVSPRGSHRPLIAGEVLQCGSPAGSLTVLDSQTYTTISGTQTHKVEPSSVLNSMMGYAQPAFTRGEAPRETIFFSPPSDGVIVPEKLIVRWKPPTGMGPAKMSVGPDHTDVVFFISRQVDIASGSLDSQELRDELARYRDRGGLATLAITLRDENGQEYKDLFTVLTPPNERKMAQRLAEWNMKDALVKHLGRASVYSDFGLYFDAATESELALQESPKSKLLLQLAVNAERRTGNATRASELETQLSQTTAKVQ